ncbi:MAG: hypothetical protein HC804_06135 [Anaerolineae bacterium]|nr:hypothetical protein [Anaerolineae bacterium]
MWSLVDSPNVNNRNNVLSDITAVSANDIWAVGEHRSANGSNVQTLIQHWNGNNWSIVASPNPDPSRNLLSGVTAVSANDIWAVGEKAGTTGPNWASLILHWNGNDWQDVPAPNLGAGTSELRDVAAVTANDVWAVGSYSSPDTGWWEQPHIAHWDGVSWTAVPAPAFGSTSELNEITAVSANDIWAVGRALESNWKTLILHWDGSTWSRVASPNLGSAGNTLLGVTAVSANDVWAVGTANSGNSTLTLHWNGSSWSLIPSPNGTIQPGINRNSFNSVTAVAANDVWAVGVQAYSTVGGAGQPIYVGYALIQHWNGTAWSEVAPATLPGISEDGELRGAVALGADNVWATGSYYNPVNSIQAYRTLSQHFSVP